MVVQKRRRTGCVSFLRGTFLGLVEEGRIVVGVASCGAPKVEGVVPRFALLEGPVRAAEDELGQEAREQGRGEEEPDARLDIGGDVEALVVAAELGVEVSFEKVVDGVAAVSDHELRELRDLRDAGEDGDHENVEG